MVRKKKRGFDKELSSPIRSPESEDRIQKALKGDPEAIAVLSDEERAVYENFREWPSDSEKDVKDPRWVHWGDNPETATEEEIVKGGWITAADFLKKKVPDPDWLIEKLWFKGAYGFVAGPPKSKKTWWGMELAVAVATGTPVAGHFIVPRPGRVLYVIEEGRVPMIQKRLARMRNAREMDDVPFGCENFEPEFFPYRLRENANGRETLLIEALQSIGLPIGEFYRVTEGHLAAAFNRLALTPDLCTKLDLTGLRLSDEDAKLIKLIRDAATSGEPIKVAGWVSVNANVLKAFYGKGIVGKLGIWREVHAQWHNLNLLIHDEMKLSDDRKREDLKKKINEWKADLVILDPFREMHDQGENAADVVSKLLRLVRDLGRGCCAVMLVHHMSKPDKSFWMARGPEMAAAIRGSSVMWGWYECAHLLRRKRDQTVEVAVDLRDGEETDSFHITLQDVEDKNGIQFTMAKPETKSRDLPKLKVAVLGLILKHPKGLTMSEISEALDSTSRGISRYLKQLVRAGKIIQRLEPRISKKGPKKVARYFPSE